MTLVTCIIGQVPLELVSSLWAGRQALKCCLPSWVSRHSRVFSAARHRGNGCSPPIQTYLRPRHTTTSAAKRLEVSSWGVEREWREPVAELCKTYPADNHPGGCWDGEGKRETILMWGGGGGISAPLEGIIHSAVVSSTVRPQMKYP